MDCYNSVKIFYYGKSILQAYIPSIGRGNNILKAIEEDGHGDKIFEIEKTDAEVIFKFNVKYDDNIIPYLKPKTSGARISPYSTKNLPKTKYNIPDEDLSVYKNAIAKIPLERILTVTYCTNSFLKSLATKKNPIENIKADMTLKGLKGKEYIHSLGTETWDKYIRYLKDNLPDE